MLLTPGFFRQAFIVLVTVGLALVTAACGGRQSPDEEEAIQLPERARYGTLRPGNWTVDSTDLNFDGAPDQFRYVDAEGRLGWSARDLDFDGTIELYEYYGPDGSVIEQEFQLDFDPGIDVVRHYEGGLMVRKELSTGYDDVFTMAKYYDASGQLLRVERDNDVDGLVDIWEYYDGGELVRFGRDEDGDGVQDVIRDAD